MKSEMVKPTPPRQATPPTWRRLIARGRLAIPSATAIAERARIPMACRGWPPRHAPSDGVLHRGAQTARERHPGVGEREHRQDAERHERRQAALEVSHRRLDLLDEAADGVRGLLLRFVRQDAGRDVARGLEVVEQPAPANQELARVDPRPRGHDERDEDAGGGRVHAGLQDCQPHGAAEHRVDRPAGVPPATVGDAARAIRAIAAASAPTEIASV